jgi:ribosomal protein L24
MRHSGTRAALPVPRSGVTPWGDLLVKKSTELSDKDGEVVMIETNDLVYIHSGGDTDSMGLVIEIRRYENGDDSEDILWIHWCYSKKEIEEENTRAKWPQNSKCTHLLSSHQEIHKADTVWKKVNDTEVLSRSHVYITNLTSKCIREAGSVKWLKKILDAAR